jgi:hypothetical protein
MSVPVLHREETPGEFAARIGIALKTFSRKVRLPDCPQNFEADEGPSGRFKSLRASRELEAYMKPYSSYERRAE